MNKETMVILFISLAAFLTGTSILNLAVIPARAMEGPDTVGTRLEIKLREFFSEFLWNRIDIYHHMWEFSGKSPNMEKSSIYLMKYAVDVNPHFEKAYSVGSFMLYDQWGKLKEGREFLMEGIRNNPRSWVLWRDLTFYSFFVNRDISLTLGAGNRALRYLKDSDLGDTELVTFLRIMAKANLDSGSLRESYRFYLILNKAGLLNSRDRENINIIKEALNGRKKEE